MVNFTAAAQAAQNAGLRVLGYTSQAAFLLNNGLLDALEQAPNPLEAVQAVKRLTDRDKIRIMHDSRVGSYGVMALCLSVVMRVSLLSSLAALPIAPFSFALLMALWVGMVATEVFPKKDILQGILWAYSASVISKAFIKFPAMALSIFTFAW